MSMNMTSKQVSIDGSAVLRVHGDDERRKIYFQLEVNKAYDIALCPLGTLDPTPHWVTISSATGTLTDFEHIGELYIKNPTGAAQGIVLGSDTELVLTNPVV